MFGWVKRKLELKGVQLKTEDIQRFLSMLKGVPDNEMGMLVAIATGIRLKFAEGGADLERLLEGPTWEWNELASTTEGLSNTIVDVQKSPDKGQVAAGMMVWLHSLRAYVSPEIRYLAQEMWGELQRGFPHVDEACEFLRMSGLVNMPAATELHCDYVPLLLKSFRETKRA